MKKYLFFAPLLFLFSCGGEGELDYEETEYDVKIKEFLSDQSWEAERQESGLYVYTENEGSEEKPGLGSYLTLNYEGRLLDGTVFDGTNGEGITFPFALENTIDGWKKGIPQFGRGGKGKLICPPDLGYGANGTAGGEIPGDAILVFDIEILDWTDTPPPPPEPVIDMSIDYSEEIEAYMAQKGWKETVKTDTRMYVIIEDEGSAEKPTLASFLTLNYEGYLLDGTSFDGTDGTPVTFDFPLGRTIGGWQEGIPYFGKGGSGTLIIPPYIGYGEYGQGEIPGNAVLVFDFEIIDWSDLQPGNPN